jgi:hypothetical protein
MMSESISAMERTNTEWGCLYNKVISVTLAELFD